MSLKKFVLTNLKTDDQIKKSIKNCKNDELIDTLNCIEKELDEEISKHNGKVDSQELLDCLHRYNEVKDMTQQLIGTLANHTRQTIRKIHQDFKLDDT